MSSRTRSCALAVVVALALPAGAVVVPGGKTKTDCFEQFDVEGATVSKRKVAECLDGDSRCDMDFESGTCTFAASLCVDQESPGCSFPTGGLRTPRVKGVAKKRGLQPPVSLTTANCGSPAMIPVHLNGKGKEPGRARLVAVAASAASRKRKKKDKDTVTLLCRPREPKPPVCAPSAFPVECAPNPNGGPDELVLSTADVGTDLDNGWTGVAHNFPVPPRATLKLCLSGCDASRNPVCDAIGPTGAGTINGETFGPPLPLIANLVPVCVVNNFQPEPITAKLDLGTGEVAPADPLTVKLFADTHFTNTSSVCPSCTGPDASTYDGHGTCDSGKNQGKACTVESIVDVVESGNTTTYRLSRDCPPAPGFFAGRLSIDLRLTTGTSTLTGPTPCGRQPGGPAGVTVKDSACNGACSQGSCTGNACVKKNADGECIDSKGGLSQFCCEDKTQTPCFPTAGGGQIVRTGHAEVAKAGNGMAWPETTYPKVSCGASLVATFCEGATDTGTINGSTGLPGPGALVLPGIQTLLKQ